MRRIGSSRGSDTIEINRPSAPSALRCVRQAYAGASNLAGEFHESAKRDVGWADWQSGAVAGAIAIHYGMGERPKSQLAERADLQERLRRIERAAGQAAYFAAYGKQLNLRDRLRVDDRLKALGRQAKRDAKGWVSRAGDGAG